MAGANAMSYRKLFDSRAATSTMSVDEMLSLCAKIRSYHEQGHNGRPGDRRHRRPDYGFRPPARRAGVGQAADQGVRQPPAGEHWIEEMARNVRRREAFLAGGAGAPGIVGP